MSSSPLLRQEQKPIHATPWKECQRRGFIHVTGLVTYSPDRTSRTVVLTVHGCRGTYGFNDEYAIVVDQNGRVWMKPGMPSMDDLAFIRELCPNGVKGDLPGLGEDRFNENDLEIRRKNANAMIS
jgi:hypothetical protein